MKEISQEVIEIDGKEYKLFLNRKGIVAYEKYCKEEYKDLQEVRDKHKDMLNSLESDEILSIDSEIIFFFLSNNSISCFNVFFFRDNASISDFLPLLIDLFISLNPINDSSTKVPKYTNKYLFPILITCFTSLILDVFL